MLRAKCTQSVLPDVVRVSLGWLEDHQGQKVAAASRLRDNEGFGARGRDARVRASRPDRQPRSRSARLDVRHQGARRAFLPDSQPQPAAFRTRSFPRYVRCLQGGSSWGLGVLIPPKYVGGARVYFDPVKCHIPSFETVVASFTSSRMKKLVSKMEGKAEIFSRRLMAWPD